VMNIDCRKRDRTRAVSEIKNLSTCYGACWDIFDAPHRRFEHVHLDIIMPVLERKRYCFICIDRFTRCSEAFPLGSQEAEMIARTFYEGRICRGPSASYHGSRSIRILPFSSVEGNSELTGTAPLRMTAYHSQMK